MVKDTYRAMNAHISPTPGLNRAVLDRTRPRRGRILRPAVALVLTLVLILSAPQALAHPAVYQLMHNVSPELAARFAPVQESCEANGIRMEVVAASVQDNTAMVYCTFQDLEGSRLGLHTYPEDFSIQGLFNWSGSLSSNYDAGTQTVTSLAKLTNEDSADAVVQGDKITFYVEYLRKSNPFDAQEFPLSIALTDSAEVHFTRDKYRSQGASLTQPAEGTLQPIQEGYDVTCMTVIDGILHVQVRITDEEVPGTFHLSLTGPRQEPIPMTYGYSFYDGATEYRHWAFDLEYRDVEDCTLTASIYPEERIRGPWRVTFDLEDVLAQSGE